MDAAVYFLVYQIIISLPTEFIVPWKLQM